MVGSVIDSACLRLQMQKPSAFFDITISFCHGCVGSGSREHGSPTEKGDENKLLLPADVSLSRRGTSNFSKALLNSAIFDSETSSFPVNCKISFSAPSIWPSAILTWSFAFSSAGLLLRFVLFSRFNFSSRSWIRASYSAAISIFRFERSFWWG